MIAELNGRFGKQLDNRPTFVIPFETEASAEDFKEFVLGFTPSDLVPEGMDEVKEQVQVMHAMTLSSMELTRIGTDLLITTKDPIDLIAAALGPFTPITSTLNCSVTGKAGFAQPL